MRTPKIESKDRAIDWFNKYIIKNKDSNCKSASTISILSKIHTMKKSPLDNSDIDSNSWLAGFSDADANFSINIHKRTNKNITRVQLYYRLEIKQNFNNQSALLNKSGCLNKGQGCVSETSNDNKFLNQSLSQDATASGSKQYLYEQSASNPCSTISKPENIQSFFPIISKIGMFLGVTVYSRSRIIKNKVFHSFTIISHNKNSNSKIIYYFNKYPLISSKYLDYKDFAYVLELQNSNSITTSYLDKTIKIRTDFNSTRTTYTWDHLKDCYLNLKKE